MKARTRAHLDSEEEIQKILTQKEVQIQTLNTDLATLRTSMKEMSKRSAAAEDSATQLKNSLHIAKDDTKSPDNIEGYIM